MINQNLFRNISGIKVKLLIYKLHMVFSGAIILHVTILLWKSCARCGITWWLTVSAHCGRCASIEVRRQRTVIYVCKWNAAVENDERSAHGYFEFPFQLYESIRQNITKSQVFSNKLIFCEYFLFLFIRLWQFSQFIRVSWQPIEIRSSKKWQIQMTNSENSDAIMMD